MVFTTKKKYGIMIIIILVYIGFSDKKYIKKYKKRGENAWLMKTIGQT